MSEERNRDRRLRYKVDRIRGMLRYVGGELIYLVKNTSREKQAKGYGGYMYITLPNGVNKVEVLAGDEPYLYSLSLAAAEKYAGELESLAIEFYRKETIDENACKRLLATIKNPGFFNFSGFHLDKWIKRKQLSLRFE